MLRRAHLFCFKKYVKEGTAPLTKKLACFMLYLKIIKTSMKNKYASYSELSKNGNLTPKQARRFLYYC